MPPLPLSASVARITVTALDRKAAQLGALLAHWEVVAGTRIGTISFPVRLNRGRKPEDAAILTLASPSAWMTELQHETPLLLKRINTFYGYQAVRQIRLVSRAAPPLPSPPPHRTLSVKERSDIDAAVTGISDERLRDALKRLGTTLQQEKR